MSCIRCIVVIIVCKIHVMLVLACQCWANTPSSGGWWWLLIGTFSGTGILGALTIICLGLVWGEVSVVTSERLYLYGQASQYLPMYCVQTRPGQARPEEGTVTDLELGNIQLFGFTKKHCSHSQESPGRAGRAGRALTLTFRGNQGEISYLVIWFSVCPHRQWNLISEWSLWEWLSLTFDNCHGF